MSPRRRFALLATFIFLGRVASATLVSGEVHVWETQEIILQSGRGYVSPYADVDCWIELEGPAFSKRIYGFWDGGRAFRVRFVATAPGDWHWTAHSSPTDDAGLNGGAGKLKAVDWTDAEKTENPNR